VGAAGGNVSARLPGKDIFLVTASGVSLRDVVPENLVAVDGGGRVLEGPPGLKASKESSFHLAIYQARPGVNAVIHVHPNYATAFAAAGRSIPLVTISSQLKLKQGALVPEAPPGSARLSRNVVQAMEQSPLDASVLLLERHGLITYNRTLCLAFDDAELAEDTAQIAFHLSRMTPLTRWLAGKPQVVDLTAPLNEHMHTYPTDPLYKRSWHVQYAEAGNNLSKLEMGAHAGSHVDAPLHYLDGGMDIVSMPLHSFMGEAIAIEIPKGPGEDVTPADLAGADIRAGDIVLVRTGWEERSCTPRFFEGEWPGFAPETVDRLIDQRVKAIGGDIASADGPRAIREGSLAHKKAMAAGLPIFEALVNLNQVVGRRFLFVGLPLKLEGCEASPIRAVAILD
jgi:L-fuculose-phosphate aldolase